MNITFLIGNGFDKALGLNTGYGDFYNWYLKQDVPEYDGYPLTHILFFKDDIKKYVDKASDADPLWRDAEEALGAYTENFTLDTVYDFIDCYEDFKDNLMLYLQEECNRFTDESASEVAKLFKKQIEVFYSELSNSEKRQLNQVFSSTRENTNQLSFIGFNYTDTLDKICSKFQSETLKSWAGFNSIGCILKFNKLVHAHGYIDKIPVIGVCDENLIKNKELLKSKPFRISMLKGECIDYAGEFWREETDRIIENSKIICIFGMSLGETDSYYWEKIIKWLSGSHERHLIIFWHDLTLKKLNTSNARNYAAKSKIFDIFLDNSSLTKDQFNALENRIHVVFNTEKLFQLTKAEKNRLIRPREESTNTEIQDTLSII